jgi:hypothetical protein
MFISQPIVYNEKLKLKFFLMIVSMTNVAL